MIEMKVELNYGIKIKNAENILKDFWEMQNDQNRSLYR